MEASLTFDYDPTTPLDVETQSSRSVDSLQIQELTFASPRGGRVPATLVVPAASGPFPGIVVAHGTAPTGRLNILPHALDLARTGAVTVLIDAPYVRWGAWPVTFTERDAEGQVQFIVDLRRAIDLLLTRQEVDPERLAFIGHSHGAAMGGLLAGVECRIGSYVLASGDGGLVSHFTSEGRGTEEFMALPEETRRRWLEGLEAIEPIQFVGRAAPAMLFYQAGLQDEAVPQTSAERFYQAGSEPKMLRWYDAGHVLNEQALLDQVEWLGDRIGIDADAFEFRHGCRRISCYV